MSGASAGSSSAPVVQKYRDINHEVDAVEMETAYAHAREAGLWRFDRRWRSSIDGLSARLDL